MLARLSWYLIRPRLYRQLARDVAKRLLPHPDHKRRNSPTAEWCARHAVPLDEAIKALTGQVMPMPLREYRRQELIEADQRAAACPVSMGGGSELDLLFWAARLTGAKKAVETGVAFGWSSLALLLAMEEGRLISTDMPYVNRNNDVFVGCVVPAELRRRWTLIRLPDRDGLPRALRELETIDLCHYDSDKSYEGRTWAYPLLWRHLKPSGIFISDDIQDNHAFRDFSEEIGVDPVIVSRQVSAGIAYIGAIAKTQ